MPCAREGLAVYMRRAILMSMAVLDETATATASPKRACRSRENWTSSPLRYEYERNGTAISSRCFAPRQVTDRHHRRDLRSRLKDWPCPLIKRSTLSGPG